VHEVPHRPVVHFQAAFGKSVGETQQGHITARIDLLQHPLDQL